MNKVILEMKNITKIFPGIKALDNVNFSLNKGEIRALVGKNGAGKSTLIKVLTGIYTPDDGEIVIDDKKIEHVNPKKMYSEGIQAIYQENDLVGYFSVAESVMLNNEPTKMNVALDRKKMNVETKKIFDENIGISLDPSSLIRELDVSEKQLVQIAKSLVKKPRIMIFDEPTAPLSAKEIERLFTIIRSLKESGVTIIYISHRFEEIFEIADTVTVFRDGKKISDLNLCDTTEEEIIRHMTGGECETVEKKSETNISETLVMKVKDLKNEYLKDINFELHKGEVLGLYGAEGAGQVDLVRSLFGLNDKKGKIYINGKEKNIKHPKDSIKNGIGYVPRDRKEESLVKSFMLMENVTLSNLNSYSHGGIISKKEELKIANKMIKDLSISTRSARTIVNFLSGGNQQKVAIARWLTFPLKILMLDYPTMGVDVQAKVEIYKLLKKIVEEGTSIIVITPEYEEIKILCDRVLVLKEGKTIGDLDVKDITEDLLLKYAIGSANNGNNGGKNYEETVN